MPPWTPWVWKTPSPGARTLGYLVGVAGKLLETGELEERLAALEAAHGQETLPESVFDAEPVDAGFSGEVDS